MPEQMTEVVEIPYLVEYVCDTCQQGKMVPDGNIAYLTSPAQYPYKCQNCGAKSTFTERYPVVKYQYVEKPVTQPEQVGTADEGEE